MLFCQHQHSLTGRVPYGRGLSYLRGTMFKNSVVSYPSRGAYGNNKYRGNCTGHIVADYVRTYMPEGNGLLADPSIGGGTSSDVAREMGIRFKGTDLHRGFNLLTDDFSSFLGEKADLVWWHPPYWNMITYSGEQWGEENPWDLSRLRLPDFVEALQLATMNIHDAAGLEGITVFSWAICAATANTTISPVWSSALLRQSSWMRSSRHSITV